MQWILVSREGSSFTGQVGHKYDIPFHLKGVRDKFEWTDKTTTQWQYEVLEGSNRLTTKSVDLKMSRGKKRVNKTEWYQYWIWTLF